MFFECVALCLSVLCLLLVLHLDYCISDLDRSMRRVAPDKTTMENNRNLFAQANESLHGHITTATNIIRYLTNQNEMQAARIESLQNRIAELEGTRTDTGSGVSYDAELLTFGDEEDVGPFTFDDEMDVGPFTFDDERGFGPADHPPSYLSRGPSADR